MLRQLLLQRQQRAIEQIVALTPCRPHPVVLLAGVFIAVLLVDAACRLPLLRISSVISTTPLLALVILPRSSGHAPQSHQGGLDPGTHVV